ncbi:MAG: polyphosphate kinase 1 [Verrucomicrobia bacterium]|nr:polyphosphate kinase 1 [Verrucomicrobiota bacterium]MBI3867528.1 polyphosphate kinase 1 [Verrucomicrobiota bacterium]
MKRCGPSHFLNRELSWLEFNQRVLDEAFDPANPLLERVKFFCITFSNLDEFFEVRVAGVKQQIESDVVERSADGLTATETFRAITKRVRRMVEDQYRCWREHLVPDLARGGIRFLDPEELSPEDRHWLNHYYHHEVRPVLTPLAIDPAHPFPQLLNKSLNTIVQLERSESGQRLRHLAVVQTPRVLPRLVRLPREDGRMDYVLLGRLIGHYLADLFPGTEILGFWHFRVTRNSELYIDEEEVDNLLNAVEDELHNRRRGDAVRLEVDKETPPPIRQALLGTLHLTENDLYVVDGPLNPTRLLAICEGDHSPELRFPPFVAPLASALRERTDLFEAIREKDILLHHPFEHFSSVISLLEQAAADPLVLAIKITLYRSGGDSRIIGALMRAVKDGKQVTAVVELRARFDEANNIQWARQLEEAGVHVVYGLVGYKIHAKVALIVRRDETGIRRYVHVGTGNYNATTARFYTDLGLLTCRPDFGEDATNLFNLLTGVCQFQGMRKLLVSPFELHGRLIQMIRQEATNARKGLAARIIVKVNSLVDRETIEALYEASQAGVQIDLIVRGVCCLRPGIKGFSETIRVRSIVGRFLEHSRIAYFENACQPLVYLGSADWMPRNFFRRIEVVFPVEDGNLKDRIVRQLLDAILHDNVRARTLDSQGVYERLSPKKGEPTRDSQGEFMALALEASRPKKKATTGKNPYPQVKLAPKPSRRVQRNGSSPRSAD